MSAKLLPIQIGTPKMHTDDQGAWETTFFKEPVSGLNENTVALWDFAW